MSAFVPLPGNGTVRRALPLPPLTDEELKAEVMGPYIAAASSAADLAFLAAAFTPISFRDAQEYLCLEFHPRKRCRTRQISKKLGRLNADLRKRTHQSRRPHLLLADRSAGSLAWASITVVISF